MNDERTRAHLLSALRRVLRALCRPLIRVGIRFDEFSSIVKAIYVDCAIREYKHHGIPSRARISALTGLTLKQVSACVDHGGQTPSADPTLSDLLVEVLHKWHTIPEYGGPYGIPLELEWMEPPNRCLRSLITLASPKANAHTILEKLIRSGAVLQAGEKRFRPVSRFFMMPDPRSPTLIERFGTSLSRLASTLEYNLNPKHPEKLLERRVVADHGLPENLIPAFEGYARGKTADFLLELDNWLSAKIEVEELTGSAADRVDSGVNVFLYVESPAASAQFHSTTAVPSEPSGLKA